MRSIQLWKKGWWRISRRDAELYSVQITSAGAWARLRIYDGTGRKLFHQFSTFTGSFWLGAGAQGGIVVQLDAMTTAPTVALNFREKDTRLE